MTTLREAVAIATDTVEALFGEQGISNVMLEEVETTSNDFWKVTIGFDRPADASNSKAIGVTAGLIAMARRRKYKVVQVSKLDGDVLSIKDRQFES